MANRFGIPEEELASILSSIPTGISGLEMHVEVHTRQSPFQDSTEFLLHGSWRYNGTIVKTLESKTIGEDGTKIREINLDDYWWKFIITNTQLANMGDWYLKEKITEAYEEIKKHVEDVSKKFNLDPTIMQALKNLLENT